MNVDIQDDSGGRTVFWEVVLTVMLREKMFIRICVYFWLVTERERERELFESTDLKRTVNDNFNFNLIFKWQVCYSSQKKYSKIPTANLNALRNSCVKIVCCSSQLIFTSLYAGSSIKNASEQFFWCAPPPLSFLIFALPATPQKKKFNSVNSEVSSSSLSLSLDNHS